jgi:hypothetical protein
MDLFDLILFAELRNLGLEDQWKENQQK